MRFTTGLSSSRTWFYLKRRLRQENLKLTFLLFGRVALTVALSTLVIALFHRPLTRTLLRWHGDRQHPKYVNRDSIKPYYVRRWEGVAQALRLSRTVQMVGLEIPGGLWNYQRQLASRSSGRLERVLALSTRVPVIAVPRGAAAFLDRNFITYIDPATLPAEVRESLQLPFDRSRLKEFVLIPDLSSSAQGHYRIVRR